jgi:DNA-binding response OmpR family regulator/anti-sigma regulatory factor (Ser/Thr protein kinase)
MDASGVILAVDDDPGCLVLLTSILEPKGFEVRTAARGAQALASVEAHPPDMILLDVRMPDMDGLEVLRRLRAAPATRDIPVMFISATDDAGERLEGLRLGAVDFIAKPIQHQELLTRLRTHLDLRRLRLNYQRQAEDLRQKVEELRRTQEQVVRQERMSALGQMASGMAHDFNNLLMPILSFSEYLLGKLGPEGDARDEERRLLQRIHEAGQQGREIIRGFKEFIQGGEHLETAPVDLAQLIEQVVKLTEPKWRNQLGQGRGRIEVVTRVEPLPILALDRAGMSDALTNLVFNAVDAMPDGGRLTLRARLQGGQVEIQVADTGRGMTDEVQRRCLEPFFTTKGEQGSGQGLLCVQRVVKRHGGALELASRPGVGTTFTLRLPIRRPAPESAPHAPPPAKAPGQALKVLVVDDEEVICQVVRLQLRQDGHKVEIAGSGREGLERVRDASFDLVVLDRSLQDMNGDDLARDIRALRPAIGILQLTGFGSRKVMTEGCPPGVDAVVGKPATRELLQEAVAYILQRQASGKGT